MARKKELSPEALEDLRVMGEALAPLSKPTTDEEKRREADRKRLLRYKSRREADIYRAKYLHPSPLPKDSTPRGSQDS